MLEGRETAMRFRLMAVAALGAVLVAGCSGSSSESESPASTPAEATAPSAASADGGCSVATVDANTSNQEMLTLATQVYESLQCGGAQTLDDQLRAAAESPEVTEPASAAGLTVSVDSAAGGTVMQMVQLEDRSACTVTVINDLDAKTLTCADL